LVLDEATSNLDQATEHRIVQTLNELRQGLTMIVVTHRPASVRRCDHIVYLEAGQIRGEGTFEDVGPLVFANTGETHAPIAAPSRG
jgi:ABC-type bacteriocin/lantibiotic exporter with double-glycine peptidase domain